MFVSTNMVIKYSKKIFVAGFVSGIIVTALWTVK